MSPVIHNNMVYRIGISLDLRANTPLLSKVVETARVVAKEIYDALGYMLLKAVTHAPQSSEVHILVSAHIAKASRTTTDVQASAISTLCAKMSAARSRGGKDNLSPAIVRAIRNAATTCRTNIHERMAMTEGISHMNACGNMEDMIEELSNEIDTCEEMGIALNTSRSVIDSTIRAARELLETMACVSTIIIEQKSDSQQQVREIFLLRESVKN